MEGPSWAREFPGAITVCDPRGIILDMNDQSAQMFEKDGGRALVGKSLVDCHPEPARSKLRHLLEARRSNVYTTEKNGVKKLVYQAPWIEDGVYRGFVELVLEIPLEIPNFVRS